MGLNSVWAAEKISITVKGIVCSFCAQGIMKKFKAEPGVKSADVSLEKMSVDLVLKDGAKLSDDRVKKVVKDAGYDVEAIERSEEK
jgi:mercuric ion binding protein